jgi:hypothetical protein
MMSVKEGLGSLVTVLLLEIQAKQEPQVAAAHQVEIVIARPQTEYLLARVIQGMQDFLEVTATREIIQVSVQERMASRMKRFGPAQVAAAVAAVANVVLIRFSFAWRRWGGSMLTAYVTGIRQY